ncbi:PadR family transcriptional regulator [Acidicapsa dinghuensis]|uniref:PadR family transcriptional regulator n=1 Tax=Acidicapsa dinghuensis TaxID=2218256 RepID=A0ABW1EHH6_9BACT|nr:PadR family transcriptional regulator [Acidicapsa dinghuensis]
MNLRLTPQTRQIIEVLLHKPLDWKYGYEISRQTGLKSGTLYPILMRLAERQLLETDWEQGEPGKPPRHIYRFTAEGLQFARANHLAEPSRSTSKTISAESFAFFGVRIR